MDVLLLAVTKLVLQQIIQHLEALVLALFVRIQCAAFLLVHVAGRADPIRRLVHDQHVLPTPDQRREHHADLRLLPGPLLQLSLRLFACLLLRVQRAPAEHRRQQATCPQVQVGPRLGVAVHIGILGEVQWVELGAPVALQFVRKRRAIFAGVVFVFIVVFAALGVLFFFLVVLFSRKALLRSGRRGLRGGLCRSRRRLLRPGLARGPAGNGTAAATRGETLSAAVGAFLVLLGQGLQQGEALLSIRRHPRGSAVLVGLGWVVAVVLIVEGQQLQEAEAEAAARRRCLGILGGGSRAERSGLRILGGILGGILDLDRGLLRRALDDLGYGLVGLLRQLLALQRGQKYHVRGRGTIAAAAQRLAEQQALDDVSATSLWQGAGREELCNLLQDRFQIGR
mmetsp:Transcript_73444/g.238891  ORF Transcript_73444/g.238891 Transcript_73444/m.238891 type:complete len:397 (-) Transcript_73444:1167-2357(-)